MGFKNEAKSPMANEMLVFDQLLFNNKESISFSCGCKSASLSWVKAGRCAQPATDKTKQKKLSKPWHQNCKCILIKTKHQQYRTLNICTELCGCSTFNLHFYMYYTLQYHNDRYFNLHFKTIELLSISSTYGIRPNKRFKNVLMVTWLTIPFLVLTLKI